jgi:hypothetical protein
VSEECGRFVKQAEMFYKNAGRIMDNDHNTSDRCNRKDDDYVENIMFCGG